METSVLPRQPYFPGFEWIGRKQRFTSTAANAKKREVVRLAGGQTSDERGLTIRYYGLWGLRSRIAVRYASGVVSRDWGISESPTTFRYAVDRST